MDNLSIEDKEKLAADPTTPPYVLEELSKNEYWEVRYTIADNSLKTPTRVLETLSKDKNWEVRINVAWNENTSLLIVEDLVNDVDASVCFAALTILNPSLPLNIVKNLAVSNEEYDDNDFYLNIKDYYFTPLHIKEALELLTS